MPLGAWRTMHSITEIGCSRRPWRGVRLRRGHVSAQGAPQVCRPEEDLRSQPSPVSRHGPNVRLKRTLPQRTRRVSRVLTSGLTSSLRKCSGADRGAVQETHSGGARSTDGLRRGGRPNRAQRRVGGKARSTRTASASRRLKIYNFVVPKCAATSLANVTESRCPSASRAVARLRHQADTITALAPISATRSPGE